VVETLVIVRADVTVGWMSDVRLIASNVIVVVA
jgi:hypothetical protein